MRGKVSTERLGLLCYGNNVFYSVFNYLDATLQSFTENSYRYDIVDEKEQVIIEEEGSGHGRYLMASWSIRKIQAFLPATSMAATFIRWQMSMDNYPQMTTICSSIIGGI